MSDLTKEKSHEHLKMSAKDKDKTNYEILTDVLSQCSIQDVAENIGISKSTINRWIELKNVPQLYHFDLIKMTSKPIDYSTYTFKQKDQFFTPLETAKYCHQVFCDKMNELNVSIHNYTYIEPSAGDGSFIKILPEGKVIGLDIEPRYEGIISQDYLTWQPENDGKYVVFGNPPFGLRGNLALRFINHSQKFADFVCFILPQLFESDGKGVPRKRVQGFNLIHTEKLKTNFYGPDKNDMKINVVFQIWAKNLSNDKYVIKDTNNKLLKIYSLSDGGTPSSSRNKNMIDKCDVYIPSTCFGENNMKCYDSFEDLPGRKGYGIVFSQDNEKMIKKCKSIDWTKVSFLSTNSALNLRTSIIASQFQ